MIQFHRPLRALWLLPLLLSLPCAVGCKAQSPSESPTPPVDPPQNTDVGSNNASPTSVRDPADEPPPCGPMMPPAPASCDRAAWFCNAEGDCSCRKQAGGAAPTSDVLVRALPESPEQTSGDVQTKPPHPTCAGASVSAPQGDCLVANWYCNGSGLCRCRA